jgi:hypothetical protein
MLATARMLANGLCTMRAPGPVSAMAVVLPRAWSGAADRPSSNPGIAQLRCSNQHAPFERDASSTHFAILMRSGTEQTRVLRAVNCWLESKRAAASCSNTALQLQRPPLLQSPQVRAPSPRCAQAPVLDQVAPPAPQHIGSAPLLTAAAAAWVDQLRAPLHPSLQRQSLLLSSPTTSALPAPCLLRSTTRTPLQPLRAPPLDVRTLTAAPQPPRVVPATRVAPASPHQEPSSHARSKSSSKPGSRCEELQQALKAELGSEHRLKASQLTAGLERELARHPNIVLKDRVAELRHVVGLKDAAAMVHSYPALLVYVAPPVIPGRLAALGGAFSAEPDSIIALVSENPGAAAVLNRIPESAEAKVKALCAAPRVSRKELLKICIQNVRVLTADHRGMPARLAALGDTLGLTPEQVADMCKRSPSSLLVDPSNAAEVCEATAVALEVERSEAALLCFKIPSLILKQPTKVAEVARWLKQYLGLTCWDLDRYLVRFGSLPQQFCMLCCMFGYSVSAATSCLPSTQGFLLSITTALLDVLAIPACSITPALCFNVASQVAAPAGAQSYTWGCPPTLLAAYAQPTCPHAAVLAQRPPLGAHPPPGGPPCRPGHHARGGHTSGQGISPAAAAANSCHGCLLERAAAGCRHEGRVEGAAGGLDCAHFDMVRAYVLCR